MLKYTGNVCILTDNDDVFYDELNLSLIHIYLDAKIRAQMRTEISKIYQRLGTTFILSLIHI